MNLRFLGIAMLSVLLGACSVEMKSKDGLGTSGASGASGAGGTNGGGGTGGGGPSDPDPDGTVSIVRDQPNVRELLLDGSYLYWLVVDAASYAREVRRCEKNNCGATQQTVLKSASGIRELRVQDDTLYFLANDGIASCLLPACTAPATIIDDDRADFIRVDASRIYWTRYRDSQIYVCPLTGCDQATTPPLTPSGRRFTIDENNLYWATDSVEADIRTIPKDGSTSPQTIAATRKVVVGGAVVGGPFVYWTVDGLERRVERCPITGCSANGPEIVLTGNVGTGGVVFDRDWLFGISEVLPADGSAVPEAFRIWTCLAGACAKTMAKVTESTRPIAALAVDAEAIYWLGDFVDATPDGSAVSSFSASIRRKSR